MRVLRCAVTDREIAEAIVREVHDRGERSVHDLRRAIAARGSRMRRVLGELEKRKLVFFSAGRSKVVPLARAPQKRRLGVQLTVHPEPRSRVQCRDGPRPCPWRSCQWHIGRHGTGCVLDVWESGARLTLAQLRDARGIAVRHLGAHVADALRKQPD